MRLNAVAVLVLFAAPVLAFLLVLNRNVPLARLEGFEAKCTVCDRKATRTLRRVAQGMRAQGLYVYRKTEYPGGMPVWCDLHGPDRLQENSGKAYFAAIVAFAVVGSAFEKIRKA